MTKNQIQKMVKEAAVEAIDAFNCTGDFVVAITTMQCFVMMGLYELIDKEMSVLNGNSETDNINK